MLYTQVELTAPNDKDIVVIWLPVPSGKAKTGEKITRNFNGSTAPDEEGAQSSAIYREDWVISQVCTTLLEEDLPPNAKKAETFKRESSSLTYMSI